jgi:hypothetical protein
MIKIIIDKFLKSYTILSNTWEKKTITFAGDTTGTFDNDNGEKFDHYFFG